MALTLSAQLKAAQDGIDHKPVHRLIAYQMKEDLPFDGALFSTTTYPESNPSLIKLANGGVCSIFTRETDDQITEFNPFLVVAITDSERTAWSEFIYSPYEMSTLGDITNLCGVELPDETIGIIYVTKDRRLGALIVDKEGTVVWAHYAVLPRFDSPWLGKDPAVIRLHSGMYLCTFLTYDPVVKIHHLWKTTSTDFKTWTPKEEIVLGTMFTIDNEIGNLSLIQESGGIIRLFFDFTSSVKDSGATVIRNIYQSFADANAVTFSTGYPITSSAQWGNSYLEPFAVMTSDDVVLLSFANKSTTLFAGNSSTGWESDCDNFVGDDDAYAANLHLDAATGDLYVTQVNGHLCGVVIFNVNSWLVQKSYTIGSSPGYNDIFLHEYGTRHKDRGEGHFAVYSTSTATKALLVIDGSANSIKQYFFMDVPDYEVVKNVDWKSPTEGGITDELVTYGVIKFTLMDSVNNRVYIAMCRSYFWQSDFLFGYIDVTEPMDQSTGLYPFHQIMYSTSIFTEAEMVQLSQMIMIRELNMMALASTALVSNSGYRGTLTLLDLSSGAVVKRFVMEDYSTFPRNGLRHICYSNGYIYGDFTYSSLNGQEDYVGYCKLDIATGVASYHLPTFENTTNYSFTMPTVTLDGRIMVGYSYDQGGVAVFNPYDNTWTEYSPTTVAGLGPLPTDSMIPEAVVYDEVTGNIIVGTVTYDYDIGGIRMFNEVGEFSQIYYMRSLPGNEWEEPVQLSDGRTDYAPSVLVDVDNVLWAVWERHIDEQSVMWDKASAAKDLSDYVVAGTSIEVLNSIESSATLNFTLSHGHLFDPHNLMSVLSPYLKKGRMVSVAFGEIVDGTPYWQPQGEFLVESTRVNYKRGEYPTITVSCASKDVMWANMNIPATERYDTDAPESILPDVLLEFAGMGPDSVVMPAYYTFPNSHPIHYQWLETDLKTIITEFLHHFQYVPHFDVNGRFAPLRIRFDRNYFDVDHIYNGIEIVDFGSDSEYASYANQVTISGEGQYMLEVTYPEEQVGTVSGTGGWWEDSNTVTRVYYSDDKQKICVDPRLVVNKSIKDFKLLWERSGGDEYISTIDPENKWCEVTIVFPGLMELLIVSIVALIAVGAAAVACTMACGPFILALSVVSSAINYMLGQVASYEYEVYAKPVGEEKQMVSYTVNDLEYQRELNGTIVREDYDDPFCYTVQDCKAEAEFEMQVIQHQRKRLSFSKVGHLQDEITDKIRIPHPYSKVLIDVLITDIKRSYTKPPKGSSEAGGLIDTITGWRL